MHQFTGMWFNPNSRGSRLRIWQPWGCKSLHAHHFAHVVQCRDSALKTRTVSVQIRPWALLAVRKHPRVAQCRGVPLKPERLQVQVLPRGPIWNVHRSSAPGLGANECVPSGKWCESTAFRQPLQAATNARVAQREPAALYPASH